MIVLLYGRDGAALKGAAHLLREQGMKVGLRSSIDCRRAEHAEPCEFAVVVDGNRHTEAALKQAGVKLRYLTKNGKLAVRPQLKLKAGEKVRKCP